MNRRTFLSGLTAIALVNQLGRAGRACAGLFRSPVSTNRLRPPGGVREEEFPAKCIRCGRCVEVCPYRCIHMLDVRDGVHAGTPLIEAEKIPCYLCMKCVEVCPTGSLQKVDQDATRMGMAVIDTYSCAAWIGTTLCRTCYDKCPYPEKAIRLDQLRPFINADYCTGCGICTYACPVTTKPERKAINIEPIYAGVENS